MYYSKPTIDPNNDKRIWLPGTCIVKSEDGGTTFEPEPTSPTYDVGLKTDHHVIRVDPANSSHIYVVGDGGLHESFGMIHRVNWDLRYPVPRQSRCTKPTRLSRCRSSGPVISCCDACCFGRAMLIGLCGRTRTEITPCALQCVW